MVIRAIFIGVLTCMVGCHKDSTLNLVEIVGLNPNNPREFSLQLASLSDGTDLSTLESNTLKFVARARLMQDLISAYAKESTSFTELAKSLQSSMMAQPLELDLATSDGISRGKTFESMLALSAFYHLDRVISFAKAHLDLDSEAHTAPLTVAVYGQILANEQYPFPMTMTDNAIYVGSADTIFLLPVGSENGLPLPMHEGVLAHEFHHRIFFKQIWANKEMSNLWPLFQSRYDQDQQRLSNRSRIILNGLDEGLADVFAVAFTGVPAYLSVSLTAEKSRKIKEQRDLDGRFAELATYDSLAKSKLDNELLSMCAEDAVDFQNLKFNAYCLGTVIAKSIYEAADKNIANLAGVAVPVIAHSLTSVANKLNRSDDFELDVFLDAMAYNAATRSADFKRKFCAQIKSRFASLATIERIPSCLDVW